MFSMDSRLGSSVEYFSLITFSDVPESYCTSNDVTCCFTLSHNMSPQSKDYIAIFPVGWKSVDDYVCSQPVVVPPDANTDRTCTYSVTFSAASLPRDSDEFFHFCYVSASTQRVCGVSTTFQFASDHQNDWELLLPLPTNDKSVEYDTLQHHQTLDMVDESLQVSMFLTADDFPAELETLKQELLNKQQDLEKQAVEYGSSMDAMQLSLDEIRRQCIDKETKLEQLRTVLEQYEKLDEKYKTELDAMKSAHADSLASQAADCQLLKLQLDNDRIRINQLTKALDNYQQKEAKWKEQEQHLQDELEKLRVTGADMAAPRNPHTATEHSAAAAEATDENNEHRDITVTDSVAETAEDDQQFADASDVLVDRTCPICNLTFSETDPEELFVSHVEDHVVKVCPICTMEFPPEYSTFESHVQTCLASSEQQHQQPPSPTGMEFV